MAVESIEIATIQERKGVAVKQVCIFITASCLMIDNKLLNKKIPKFGSFLFFTGATDFLCQHYKLEDEDFHDVLLSSLQYFGMSKNNANYFIKNISRIVQDEFCRNPITEGGESMRRWLCNEDKAPPRRLWYLVNEWVSIGFLEGFRIQHRINGLLTG